MRISLLKYFMSKFIRREKVPNFDLPDVSDMEILTQIAHDSTSYYELGDLVYFEKMNAYGAFKYNVVKEIMMSSDFGVSPMHIELNHIYFQKDEKRHQHNKKIAIKELSFVAKELQFRDNEFTTFIFEKLFTNLPKNQPFNLVDELINPLVFISALNDLGFLELLKQFNFDDKNFNLKTAIDEVQKCFAQRDYLEELFKKELQYGKIPPTMQNILDNASVEEPYTNEDLPKFFTSMVFANAESVASFMTSFIYFLFKYYSDVLESNDWNKMENLANEVLRIYIPTPMAFRTVYKDIDFHGKRLKEGDFIVLFLRAANLDSSVFEQPKDILFGRTTKHLSFGRGKLACIGQFASFRITMNVVKELAKYKQNLVFLDDEPLFDFVGMLKIKNLNARLND